MSIEPTEPTEPGADAPVPARAELAVALEAFGWRSSARLYDPVPEHRKRFASKMDPHAGHYRVTVSAPYSRNRRPEAPIHQIEFDYSVGSGIIARWAGEPGRSREAFGKGWDPRDFRAPRWRSGSRMSLHQFERWPRILKAFRPELVDLVCSLLLDSADVGARPGATFREWVDDSGLEWTDPADALEAFEAANRADGFLRRVLTSEERERWLELAYRF